MDAGRRQDMNKVGEQYSRRNESYVILANILLGWVLKVSKCSYCIVNYYKNVVSILLFDICQQDGHD